MYARKARTLYLLSQSKFNDRFIHQSRLQFRLKRSFCNVNVSNGEKHRVSRIHCVLAKHNSFKHATPFGSIIRGISAAVTTGYNFSAHPYSINSVRHFSDTTDSIDVPMPITPYFGIFKTISESAPVEFTQDSLQWFHLSTGLPWWATIVVSTIILRTVVTFPLALHQQYVFAKLENLSPEIKILAKQAKSDIDTAMRLNRWTERHATFMYRKSVKEQWNKLIVRDNCHPMKTIALILIQVPLWISMSVALRNMAYMLPWYNPNAPVIHNELTTGGFGWILDLTQVDPVVILPVLLGLTNLAIIEMRYEMLTTDRVRRPFLRNIARTFSLLMIPLAAFVPSCVSLYWATSSLCGLLHNFLLMSPKIRRIAGVPQTKSEISYPYSHLWQIIKGKFNLHSKP